MRICFNADVHIGNYGKNGGPMVAGINQRCQDVFNVFGNTIDWAIAHDALAYVALGDLYDYDRVEPQVESWMQKLLSKTHHAGIENVLLVGNHDQKSDAPGDHAMAPLLPYGSIVDSVPEWFSFHHFDKKTSTGLTAQMLVIPFRSGRAENWLPEIVDEVMTASQLPEADTRILCFHLGISDSATPYFLDGADDSICLGTVEKLCKEYGFTHVFAGNWHNHARWNVDSSCPGGSAEIVQVGTLSPNRFSEKGGRRGCMAVLDIRTGEVEIVDFAGPRFIRLTTFDELEELDADDFAGASPAYISVIVQPDEEDAAETELKALQQRFDIRHWEVHIDHTAELDQAKAAVAAAVDAESQEAAVTSYIDEAPLEDVDRGAVHTFVQECIREAR